MRLSLGFYSHEETFTAPVAALLSVAIPVAILIVRLLSFSSIVGPRVFLISGATVTSTRFCIAF